MSNGFYTGNAVYEAIDESPQSEDFLWRTGNSWLLTYGDQESNPRVLVYAEAIRGDPLSTESSESQDALVEILSELAGPLRLPVLAIRYDVTSPLRSVGLTRQSGEEEVDLEQLSSTFESFGLRLSDHHVKEINAASSSTYHDWQRRSLGGRITVSDIDLIRTSDDEPVEMIETNRSIVSVERWRPYEVDYPKFRLVWNIASSNELPMTILYNHRTKTPFHDDISTVSIFSMDFDREGGPWERLGSFPFAHFLNGEYLD